MRVELSDGRAFDIKMVATAARRLVVADMARAEPRLTKMQQEVVLRACRDIEDWVTPRLETMEAQLAYDARHADSGEPF